MSCYQHGSQSQFSNPEQQTQSVRRGTTAKQSWRVTVAAMRQLWQAFPSHRDAQRPCNKYVPEPLYTCRTQSTRMYNDKRSARMTCTYVCAVDVKL